MKSEKLTIIVGAGASHDCADPANTHVAPGLKPPLTKELFAFRPDSFNKILAKYRRAELLSDDVRSKVANGISIENLMNLYRQKADPIRRGQYWEIPLYLQELLWQVSEGYVVDGVTRFETLIAAALLDSPYKKVMLLTTNYDLFLEKALARLTPRYRFHSPDDYISGDQKWLLVKLHGSVNWGRELLNQPPSVDNRDRLFDVLHADFQLSSEVRILEGYRDHQRFKEGRFYYPALSVPLGGVYEFQCPESHVHAASSFLRDCADYLVLGFSALDHHVLEFLRGAPQFGKLMIVARDKSSAGMVFENMLRGVGVNVAGFRSRADCLYEGGFGDFMGHAEHEKFLSLS